MTCEELCTVTYLHLSPTDVLLSLAPYDSQLVRSEFTTAPSGGPGDHQVSALVYTPPAVVHLIQSLQGVAGKLDEAAEDIRKELKKEKKKKAGKSDPPTK